MSEGADTPLQPGEEWVTRDEAERIAEAAARRAVASLAGLVLENVREAVNTKDPAHRTSGSVDLSRALAGAFGEALEKYGEQ